MASPTVCVFSKHLQFITDFAELARTCKALGLGGVDLTVRNKGHVLPENAAQDLDSAVQAFRAEGLDVPMITTGLCRGDDPHAESILAAASKLGIHYFRVGGQHYADTGDIVEQLAQFTEGLRSLARLAERYGVIAGYHNHSGHSNVGAPIWDLYRMFEDVGSDALGSNFDVGHARVEGAYGAWEINARLMASRVKMMAVKDFVWDGDQPRWVPLGQGIAPTAQTLAIFRKVGFAGPISIHIEYKTDSHDALLEEIRQAAATLRADMKQAGY